MNLAQQLSAYGLPVFPVTAKKRPSVKGWQTPLPPNEYQWPTGKVGVPIPAGCFVIDLDVYKGVTRQAVEQRLGCTLPWDDALIQRTANGGEHYAFNHNGDELMQGSDLFKLVGFDSRRAGAGFIVTGEGYTANRFGVGALAYPGTLPALPPTAALALRKPERAAEKPTKPLTPQEVENAKSALATIDPDEGRDDWIKVLMAVRHLFADDAETGLQVFHDWSAGEYTEDREPPSKYLDYDHVAAQWDSIKPSGGVSGGTLYHKAMENGWRAPAGFDASSVFGQGAAAIDVYGDMIDDINGNALNPKEQPRIIDAVNNFPGSPTQLAALKGLVIKLLKEDNQLTKQLREMLDGGKAPTKATTDAASVAELPAIVTLDQVPERQISRATGAHGSNAAVMLSEVFGGRLAMFDGVLRWWTGVEWQRADEDVLNRLASAALSPDQDKMPNVKGTVQALALKAPRRDSAKADRRVYFQNGVLDVEAQTFNAHNPSNNNTGALSVSYNNAAPLGEWGAHLDRIFGGLYDGQDRIALLQEVVGWLLITDDLNVQKCVAFDGATRAGKGVIFDVLADIIGTGKCGFANFANLANGKTQSLFMHHDVVFDHEGKQPPRQEVKEAIGFMNKVASNEPVSIQLLNVQTPWTGRLNSKFLFACNGIPVMVDDSGASTTRFLVLRFDRSFEGREDKGIAGRMRQCLEGVAAWGIVGLQRLLANGGRFTQPASSIQATDDMKDGNQPLREFITEHCMIGAGLRCHAKDLWGAYRVYVADANIKASSKHAFFRSLRATLLAGPVEEKKGLRIDGVVSNGFEGITINTLTTNGNNIVAGTFGKQ